MLKTPTKLVLLDSIKITLDASKPLPTRLKLMDWGSNASAKGTFKIGDVTVAQLAANQVKTNFDRVALDFEHNTVPTSPTYKGEPAPVAGHGTPEVVAGDGLYLSAIEWTDDGTKFVGNRHYTDLSPTIFTDENGEVVFLHSAAVCRQGALVGRSITLSATDLPALQTLSNSEDKLMKDLLLKLLGLSATATDAEIATAAEAHAKKLETLSAAQVVEVEKKVEKGADTVLLATLKALGLTVENLAKEVTGLKAAGVQSELQQLVALATSEGKVIPKEFLEGTTALTVAQLQALVANLPSTIPLERRTPTKVAGVNSGAIEALSADEAVRKNLGISKENWDKYSKAA